MSETGITATIKGDGAAPWIVFHAEDLTQLGDAINGTDGELLQSLTGLGVAFAAAYKLAQSGAGPTAIAASPPRDTPQMDSLVTPQAPVQTAWDKPQTTPAGGPTNGMAHPAGTTCIKCGGVIVFKRTNPRASDNKTFAFWNCVNQAKRDDGHFSEFAN